MELLILEKFLLKNCVKKEKFDTIRPDYFSQLFKTVKVLKKDFNTVHKSKRIVCMNV